MDKQITATDVRDALESAVQVALDYQIHTFPLDHVGGKNLKCIERLLGVVRTAGLISETLLSPGDAEPRLITEVSEWLAAAYCALINASKLLDPRLTREGNDEQA